MVCDIFKYTRKRVIYSLIIYCFKKAMENLIGLFI